MLIGLLLWSGLTLLFMWRFRVILLNFQTLVRPAQHWYQLPQFDARPIKQLAIWIAELLMLAFFYQVAGVSVLAHLTASVVAFGLMWFLRESDPNLLRSIQVIPLPIDYDTNHS